MANAPLLILFNPVSGSGRAEQAAGRLAQTLRAAGHETVVTPTRREPGDGWLDEQPSVRGRPSFPAPPPSDSGAPVAAGPAVLAGLAYDNTNDDLADGSTRTATLPLELCAVDDVHAR